ncbi:cytochrome B [Thalassospira xiamenensis]|nr:cytochrome B [Thalassospira xiamenensis]
MRTLVRFSLIFALVVIVLGAYTRLTDAGLGCPDWPGCYGFLSVPKTAEHISIATSAFPDAPLEQHKAWNEMVHRYAAGILGLLILAIAIVAFRKRDDIPRKPLKLPFLLLALVIFQAALGMWTVTMNLQPIVVMAHLLGGFSTISLLYLLSLRLQRHQLMGVDTAMRKMGGIASLALIVVIAQIALGGWVAANYAALACTQLPICEGNWSERLDILGAFSVPAADTYQYGAHDYAERMTMHVAHRIGAIVTLIVVGYLVIKGWLTARSNLFKRSINIVALLLVVQILLGLSNVIFMLPLGIAVAHNAVGVLLLMSLVALNYNIARKA